LPVNPVERAVAEDLGVSVTQEGNGEESSSLSQVDDGRQVPAIPGEGRRRLIAISSRVGVWGIIGGLLSGGLGFVAPRVSMITAAIGFFLGGLGSIAASLLVCRDLKSASLPLKLAALVGLPFGASLLAVVATFFLGFPGWTPLISLAAPAAVVLGIVLVVLLVTGLVWHGLSQSSEGGEY